MIAAVTRLAPPLSGRCPQPTVFGHELAGLGQSLPPISTGCVSDFEESLPIKKNLPADAIAERAPGATGNLLPVPYRDSVARTAGSGAAAYFGLEP